MRRRSVIMMLLAGAVAVITVVKAEEDDKEEEDDWEMSSFMTETEENRRWSGRRGAFVPEQALTFQRINDIVGVGSLFAGDEDANLPKGSFTFQLQFRLNDFYTNRVTLVDADFAFHVMLNPTGRGFVDLRVDLDYQSYLDDIKFLNHNFSITEWHEYTVIYDKPKDQLTVYVDAELAYDARLNGLNQSETAGVFSANNGGIPTLMFGQYATFADGVMTRSTLGYGVLGQIGDIALWASTEFPPPEEGEACLFYAISSGSLKNSGTCGHRYDLKLGERASNVDASTSVFFEATEDGCVEEDYLTEPVWWSRRRNNNRRFGSRGGDDDSSDDILTTNSTEESSSLRREASIVMANKTLDIAEKVPIDFLPNAFDPLGEELEYHVLRLPHNGTLEEIDSRDEIRPLNVTSTPRKPVYLHSRYRYVPDGSFDGTDHGVLLQAVSADGRRSNPSVYCFKVAYLVDDLPQTVSSNAALNSTSVIVPLQAIDVDTPFLVALILSLPTYGSLRLRDAVTGEPLREISTPFGASSASTTAMNTMIRQYAKRIRKVSSWWLSSSYVPDAFGNFSSPWHATQILGPPLEDPSELSYTDSQRAWSPSTITGDSENEMGSDFFGQFEWNPLKSHEDFGYTEFIEIEFQTPVHISRVEIGENRGAGAVISVKTLDEVSQEWGTLWSSDGVDLRVDFRHSKTKQYRLFAPDPLCQMPFASRVLRLELNTRDVKDWNEIDYVLIEGAPDLFPFDGAFSLSSSILEYSLDVPSYCGEDSFEWAACDCFYSSARTSDPATATILVPPEVVAPLCDDNFCGPIEQCPAGEYYYDPKRGGASSDSDMRYYNVTSTAGACRPCEPGTFASEPGFRRECVPCPPGSYQDESNGITCVLCSSTSFNEDSGQTFCESCPQNSFIADRLKGSTTRSDCICERGYYASSYPISEPCKACDTGSTCFGGLTLPVPDASYWLSPEYDQDLGVVDVYPCKYKFLCLGGSKPVACAATSSSWNSNATTESVSSYCVDGQSAMVPLASSTRSWCSKGWASETPECADNADGYFTVATQSIRCPSNLDAGVFTALCWLALGAVFYLLNDVVRSRYQALDLVLSVYQDAGIVVEYWFLWPRDLSKLFLVFQIALFDVDVLSPTCSFEDWGFAHAFALMLSLPFLNAFCVFARSLLLSSGAALFPANSANNDAFQKRDEIMHRAVGSTLRLFVGSAASLLAYCLATFECREFQGYGRVFSISPPDYCGRELAATLRVVAVFYVIFMAFVLIYFGKTLYRAHSENKLCTPSFLTRYGFMYSSFRAGALHWGFARLAKQALLVSLKVLLWRAPSAQAICAIFIMTSFIAVQSRVAPNIDPRMNQIELIGAALVVLTITLGVLFTYLAHVDDSEKNYHDDFVRLFYVIQSAYLAFASVIAARDVHRVSIRDVLKFRILQLVKSVDSHLKKQQRATLRRAASSQRSKKFNMLNDDDDVTIACDRDSSASSSGTGRARLSRSFSRSLSFKIQQTKRPGLLRIPFVARALFASSRASSDFACDDDDDDSSVSVSAAAGASSSRTKDDDETKDDSGVVTVRPGSENNDDDDDDDKRHPSSHVASVVDSMRLREEFGEVKKLLSSRAVDNFEILQTFYGSTLIAFVKDKVRSNPTHEILKFFRLNQSLSPFISDHSFTNNFSNSFKAIFYRKLQTFLPELLDIILVSTEEERQLLTSVFSRLERESQQRAVGRHHFRTADLVEEIDRSSVLYYALYAGAHQVAMLRSFVEALIAANKPLARRLETYRRRHAAKRLQRAWRAFRHEAAARNCRESSPTRASFAVVVVKGASDPLETSSVPPSSRSSSPTAAVAVAKTPPARVSIPQDDTDLVTIHIDEEEHQKGS